jgi:hypothetical protein
MEFVKKNIIVIAIVLAVLIMVLIRSFGGDHFKSDAKKWAEPSIMLSNIIPAEKIGTLSGEILIIRMGEKAIDIIEASTRTLNITADSILTKEIFSFIQNNNGPVLLVSDEMSVSARIWMVLSQLGFDNIFIITDDPDNDNLKYKFRPDTSIRPEL